MLYANPEYAAKMRYPKEWADNLWGDCIRDMEGRVMRHWREAGIFDVL